MSKTLGQLDNDYGKRADNHSCRPHNRVAVLKGALELLVALVLCYLREQVVVVRITGPA